MSRGAPGPALTGADYFFLGLDHATRAARLPPLGCGLAVTLSRPLTAEALRQALDCCPLSPWLAGARWGRPLPLTRPVWRLTDCRTIPTIERAVGGEPAAGGPFDLQSLAELEAEHRRKAASLKQDRTLNAGFELIHRGPNRGSTLIFRWHHGLLDARGAALLLAHLGQTHPSEQSCQALAWDNGTSSEPRFTEQLRAAGDLKRRMRGLCHPPVLSFCDRRPSGRVFFRFIDFTEAQTQRFDQACESVGAGFRKSVFIMAAAMHAFEQVRQRRGAPAGACVVNIPQDRRRAGALGPILSNRLSFMLFRAEASALGSVVDLVAALKDQMLNQMRQRQQQDFESAMGCFLHLPLGLYARTLQDPQQGAPTFCFSDAGDLSATLSSLFAADVVGITLLPPVTFPPGIQLAASRFRQRLSLAVAWAEGCLTHAEVSLLEEVMARTLVPDPQTPEHRDRQVAGCRASNCSNDKVGE